MLNVPVPAFAVTVPLTGCVTVDPSTLIAVAFAAVPERSTFRFDAVDCCTVTVPETGCAVVPVGSTRSGAELVPISVPDWLRRLMCRARFGVMRAEAACPVEIAVGGVSSKRPPTGLIAVVPVVNAPLSANPAEDEHPESQVTCRLLPVACATVKLPLPAFAVTVPETLNVPDPAFAVTVPETACVPLGIGRVTMPYSVPAGL